MWQPLREEVVIGIEATLYTFAEKQNIDISYEAGGSKGDSQALEMQEKGKHLKFRFHIG
jgi:hypothetical protein